MDREFEIKLLKDLQQFEKENEVKAMIRVGKDWWEDFTSITLNNGVVSNGMIDGFVNMYKGYAVYLDPDMLGYEIEEEVKVWGIKDEPM